jgi:hypothetical protein
VVAIHPDAAIERPQTILDAFRTRCRDWGLKRTLYWYLMSQLSKLGIHVHYVFLGADLKQPGDEPAPSVHPGYTTRLIDNIELLPFAGVVPGISREFVELVARRGDECVANFFGAELVGYGFSSRSRTRVTDQLDVLVPRGFRYGYKAWTHPDHRLMQLSRMRAHVRLHSVERPRNERSLSYIETHNYDSLLRRARIPTERRIPMGLCGWFTIFGRQIPFNTRRAKWIGFEFVRKEDERTRLITR